MRKILPISESTFYECGDVVVVPFPFSDRLEEKRRPALVFSGEAVAREGMVWLAMITSARQRPLAHDWPIQELLECGLNKKCVVRPAKITGIEPSRVLRRIGRLKGEELLAVLATMRSLIGDQPISHP